MPMLRPRHEAFARRRVIALDEPASASYRVVGYHSEGNSAYSCASRLLRSAKVAQRIDELRQEAARRHERTIDHIGEQLHEAHDMAMRLGQAGAAVAASMALAKLYGLIVNRGEHRDKSEFDGCNTVADVVDTMVAELGDEQQALQAIENIKQELLRRMNQTRAVEA